MRITRIRLHNYRSWGDADLDLSEIQAAVVSGANGGGKTKLIESVRFAIWGKFDGASLDEVVRLGTTEASTEVEFLHSGGLYRVRRERSTKGRGVSALSFLVQGPEGWTSLDGATMDETQDIIVRTIGLTYDLAVATMLRLQESDADIARAKPADRRRVLATLLGLDRFLGWRTQALGRRKSEVVRSEELVRQMDALKPKAEERPALEEQTALAESGVTAAEEQATRAKIAEETAQAGVDVAQASLDAAARRLSDYNAMERQKVSQRGILAEKQAALRIKQVTIDSWAGSDVGWHQKSLDAEKAILAKKQAALESLRAQQEAAIAEATTLRQAAADADKALADERMRLTRQWQAEAQEATTLRESLAETLRGLEAKHQDIRAAAMEQINLAKAVLNDYEHGVQAVQNNLRRAQENAGLIDRVACHGHAEFDATFKACPLLTNAVAARDSLLDLQAKVDGCIKERDERAADLAARLDANGALRLPPEANDLAVQIADAKAKTDAANINRARFAVMPTFGAELATFQADVILAHRLADDKANALARIAAHVTNAKNDCDAQQRLVAQCEQAVESARKSADILVGLRAELAPLESAVNDARKELERLAADPNGDPMIPSAYSAAQAVLADAKGRQTTTRGVYEGALRAVSTVRETAATARARLQAALEAENQIATLAAQRATTDRAVADLDTMAHAYQDAPTMILETVIPEIEQECNRLLARVSVSGLSVTLATQRAQKTVDTLAEKLEVVVRDTYGERSYESYSGGERFRLDWALRVSLAWVLASRAGVPLETMVIDEGMGALDAQGVEAFAAVLPVMIEMFGLSLVVTHVDELKDAFPTRLEVSKGTDGSVVSVVQ